MASKDQTKPQKRVVVKKSSSPYAPMLKLVYRALIGFGILVVIWMGYEIFNTARVGMKQYDQQQSDYNNAMGVKKPAEQPAEDDKKKEEDDSTEEDEGSGN